MAGIGFEIRKLLRRDDLLGIAGGYTHSALTATGPWLLTIVTLMGIVLLGGQYLTTGELSEFRLIVIYNFAFSLVITGPIVIIATRYLADAIYSKDVEQAPSMMLGFLLLLLVVDALAAVPFYLFYLAIDRTLATIAIVNFLVVASIWLISAFLSALKDYTAITRSFAAGAVVTLGSAAGLAWTASAAALMAAFTGGLTLVLFLLIARVLAEYPYPVVNPFVGGGYFRKYWDLALSGLVYNLGIWIDKWIMWFAPERDALPGGLVAYQDYDSAMFLAYLTIVPSLAAFVMSIETEFYERYLQFFKRIREHGTLETIEAAQRDIVESTLGGARTFIVLQGSICVATILVAPKIFSIFHVSFAQIGMFRIGVLGAFFHVLFLALSIVLSYFDRRKVALGLQLVFLASNAVFTLAAMKAGFSYYGYGYFLAAVTTFACAFIATARCLDRLPFQTFVLSNSSVER